MGHRPTFPMTPLPSLLHAPFRSSRRRGAALVIVLALILVITVLVIGLVLYLVRMLPLDGQIKNVVQIIVIVIGIISLLRYLAVF